MARPRITLPVPLAAPSSTRLPRRSATDWISDLAATTRCDCFRKQGCNDAQMGRGLAEGTRPATAAAIASPSAKPESTRPWLTERILSAAPSTGARRQDHAGRAAHRGGVATAHAQRMTDQAGHRLADRENRRLRWNRWRSGRKCASGRNRPDPDCRPSSARPVTSTTKASKAMQGENTLRRHERNVNPLLRQDLGINETSRRRTARNIRSGIFRYTRAP